MKRNVQPTLETLFILNKSSTLLRRKKNDVYESLCLSGESSSE